MTDTTNTTAAKHYAKRDPEAQGNHYINHVYAMTTEGLHATRRTSQLAHSDIEIERLRAALAAPAQAAAPIKTLTEAIAHAEDKAKGNSACAMEHAKLAAWLTELQLLRAAQTAPVDTAVQRDAAIGMLADWVHAVNTNGTGWDDWDEHFKDAAFRPGPLRELLDDAIAARAAQGDDK